MVHPTQVHGLLEGESEEDGHVETLQNPQLSTRVRRSCGDGGSLQIASSTTCISRLNCLHAICCIRLYVVV